MDRETILELITEYAVKYELEPAVVYGVCMKESTLNMYAHKHEPGYRWVVDPKTAKPRGCNTDSETRMQETSHGIMQVMGATYREQGFKGWLPMVYSDVRIQLDHGCKYLSKQIKRFGSVESGVAAYNAGRPVRMAGGVFENQEYVDAVLTFAREWA